MIIESGVIIFVGLLFLFIKLPRRIARRLLGRPLALDLTVRAVAYALHWGTFTGVMAAAVAGLMCSGFTIFARVLIGYRRATRLCRASSAQRPRSRPWRL
jgi:hypothetical protein